MRKLALIFALTATWIGTALLAMLPGTIATAAIPNADIELPASVSVIDVTDHLLILRSEDPAYVRQLYAAGAAFVIPARQKTCLDSQT